MIFKKGLLQTFLGCRGEAKILDSVLRCCASLYAFQSVEYRRQNGQPVVTGMGVVVQEMVEAEAAGVMFTRDPVTGSPGRIVITANFGLGEVRHLSKVWPFGVDAKFPQ